MLRYFVLHITAYQKYHTKQLLQKIRDSLGIYYKNDKFQLSK